MFEDRSLKLDLCALVLLAGVAFLAASLWTYDRFDRPSTLLDPPREAVQNACGSAGAYTANFLFESLGFGAYYMLGSLGALTGMLLLRREIDQPIVRSVGWTVSLIGLATLIALLAPNWTPGPVIGSGGYVGAMGRGLLEMHFAKTGAFIFSLSVLAAGLLLTTDYFLLRAAAVTTTVSGRSLAQLGHMGHSVVKRSNRVKTDLEDGDEIADALADEDEEEETGEEDGERQIRIRTPADKAEEAAADDEEDEESDEEEAGEEEDAADDEEEEASDDEEAAPTGRRFADGLKAALGIKSRRGGPADKKAEEKSEREELLERLEEADQQADQEIAYELPPLDLLLPNEEICYEEHEKEVRRKAKILEKTFKNFGFNVKVVEIETGPVIAQYEIELEAGLRLAKISNLADDLAIALRVPSVRIVAPIPGKNTVGIEVPNENRQLVRLREVIEETNGRAKRMKIPIYLGKDVAGNPLTIDLTSLPHLLIAGRTGTGKSVCLNSIIVSILMSRGPDEVRMLMIDPKMVELNGYSKLPHLMHPVVTDMRKAEAILAWAVDKMEERYQLLSRAGVRHVSVYNQLGEEELRERIRPDSEEMWKQVPRQLPFIVIVADELADLMMTSGKEVEQHIIRLAQKSRAVGIHLILATQKPTVDVITGLIKSNLPARIAFQVASRTDSRVVLDEMGADKLLGNGDMLFLSPGTSMLLRGQGTYLSDDEITRVVDFVGTDDPQFAGELMQLKTKEELEAVAAGGGLKNRDELYETAVDIVVRERRGSVSLLQRALGIGYGRAARLVDFMAEDGIVGEYNGSQAREVMISIEDWEAMSSAKAGEAPAGGAASALPGGGLSSRPATVDALPRYEKPTPVTTATQTPAPRRNRIVPEPEEPSDLEDDSTAPFGDDVEDQWDDEDSELEAEVDENENFGEDSDADEDFEADGDDEAEEIDEADDEYEGDEDEEDADDDGEWDEEESDDEEEGDAEEEWDDADDEDITNEQQNLAARKARLSD
ncbi:MAG: DNA translocase FtsK 4TM domain-containing protein [Pirellulales bacterium]